MRRLAIAISLLSLVACSAASSDDTGSLAPEEAVTDPRGGDGTSAPGSEGGSARAGENAPGAKVGESVSEDAQGEDSLADLLDLPVTKQDWMARTPGLADKPMSEIFMPGTHDSGTYDIQSVYARPVTDVFSPDSSMPITRAGQFIAVADKWAKAQEKTIAEQLNDGVRSLDFRPCAEKNGTLRVCHNVYAAKMSDMLEDVRVFAAAHPKEIIVVLNQNFAGMDDAAHAKLLALYDQKLGGHMLDRVAGNVTPASTLRDVWTKQPGKNVFVVYDDAHRPAKFWSGDAADGGYEPAWERADKKSKLTTSLTTAKPAERFFLFSGAATPDDTLITRSLDFTGTYPTSLGALADATNPVVLGWLRDDWAAKPANIITMDFYNRTCIFELTQRLNGNLAASLDGCAIGTKTSWGNWRLGYEIFGYGRGAGTPFVCDATEENRAGLCYPKCQAGYSAPVLFPYLCTTACPAGYRDDGLTCFRDASIVKANNKHCSVWDKCGLTIDRGCSTCPSGYTNDGCTCRRDAKAITKSRYDRGIGRVPHTCAVGEEKSGLLCYPECNQGFHGVGPMCMPND